MTQLIRGRYEPLEVVGRGGQGEVIRALDRQHERQVAIKMRPLSSDADREVILSEARVLLSVKPHANLPLVREDFFEDDRYYLVMDWVEGRSLQHLLEERGDPGLAFSRVSRYLEEVAGALDHLHGHEPPIIHKDVKPANIIATKADQAVLVDFGISAHGKLGTRSGGTRGFIAPEVVAGTAPGPAADIYGLAATAYALLTGSVPTGDRPHWEGLPQSAVASVERAIRKALSSDPSRRPQSARLLVEQMRAWLDKRLPTGTVTFLFTDIEGSTRMWDENPEEMRKALSRHDLLVAEAIDANGGKLVESAGDSILAVFERAADALAGAVDLQRALSREAWPPNASVRVRIAIHAGEAELRDGNYYGLALYRSARLMETAHGGQTLVSRVSVELAGANLPEGARLQDLGSHRLRDLAEPEQVFQLCHPDLPEEFPPLRSLKALPNNLPIQLTSFVGREEELIELRKVVSGNRLVTLTGAGGVGKTRLALQVATSLMDDYSDGAWLVDLASLNDPGLVTQAVAATLGVREVTTTLAPVMPTAGEGSMPRQIPLIDRLIGYLSTKKILLVVDNCEHLISASADLADTLVRACPGLTILVTSREPLGIKGEAAWRVPSLSFPDVGDIPAPEDLAAYEAVRLFDDRAKLSQSHFQINESNSAAVSEICRRLDGIPLAIELAAARVQVLTPEQIADRLDDRFRLLTGGSRTALERQQTLRATVDWSHDLLSAPEQILLRRLSIFAGGFTLDAAEKVCPFDDLGPEEILDLLSQLAAKSLVEVDPREGVARYRLLETVRQYAREKLLDSREAGALHSKHRNYYLGFAEAPTPSETEERFWSEPSKSWLDSLASEHDNLRAALRWSVSERDGEAALRLALSLWEFWDTRGHLSEGRGWLDEALALGPVDRADLRPRALGAAGSLALGQDLEQARVYMEEALKLVRERRVVWGVALALGGLGRIAALQGDNVKAHALLGEALTLARSSGNRDTLRTTLWQSGELAMLESNYATARAFYQESLEVSREDGYSGRYFGSVDVTIALGRLEEQEGNFDTARLHFEEAQAFFWDLGNTEGVAWQLLNLGELAFVQGAYETARGLVEEARPTFREIGERWAEPSCLRLLGSIYYVEGDNASARSMLEEALARGREFGLPRDVAVMMGWLGKVALEEGKYEEARSLFEKNVRMTRQVGAKHDLVFALHKPATLALAQGEIRTAKSLLEEALTLARQIGAKDGIAESLKHLATLARAEGGVQRAGQLYRESLAIHSDLGVKLSIAECLEGLAGIEGDAGDFDQAASLFGAAEGLRENIGAPLRASQRPANERDIGTLRTGLDAEGFDRAWAEGRTLSLRDAVELALKEPGG